MALAPGSEFNIASGLHDPEIKRMLLNQELRGADKVTSGFTDADKMQEGQGGKGTVREQRFLDMVQMIDANREMIAQQQRILESLDRMEEASVHALQDIEQELLILRRVRERMLEQAYRDEQGRAVFMTEDGSAAFYEDGTKVDDEKFGRIKGGLEGKTSWDKWQDSYKREDGLESERDRIHAHEEERDQLRRDVESGKIAPEEAQKRAEALDESMPERLRGAYNASEKPDSENDVAQDTALSADEEALLNAHTTPLPTGSTFKPG